MRLKTNIVQISAGVGPVEVREFVSLLARELVTECEAGGLEVRSVSVQGDEEVPSSVSIEVVGPAREVLAASVGTHVLLARSPRRGRRSRKRWFAGVSIHPLTRTGTRVLIRPDDVEVTAARAGGPGGQHVNTTDSAVRIRHRPTGVTVRVSSERSQHRNRRIALARLEAVLAERGQANRARGVDQRRRAHYLFERGSAVREWVLDPRASRLRPA